MIPPSVSNTSRTLPEKIGEFNNIFNKKIYQIIYFWVHNTVLPLPNLRRQHCTAASLHHMLISQFSPYIMSIVFSVLQINKNVGHTTLKKPRPFWGWVHSGAYREKTECLFGTIFSTIDVSKIGEAYIRRPDMR